MQTDVQWTAIAKKRLEGRKIVNVRYMTKKEAREWMWDSRPVVFELDDGSVWFASADDEGNDGGALFGQKDGEDIGLPVLWVR